MGVMKVFMPCLRVFAAERAMKTTSTPRTPAHRPPRLRVFAAERAMKTQGLDKYGMCPALELSPRFRGGARDENSRAFTPSAGRWACLRVFAAERAMKTIGCPAHLPRHRHSCLRVFAAERAMKTPSYLLVVYTAEFSAFASAAVLALLRRAQALDFSVGVAAIASALASTRQPILRAWCRIIASRV